MRWESVSKTPLGTKADIASIRASVLKEMNMPKAKVGRIGWLSPTVVMVSFGWYEGPLGAAGYTYVVQKRKDGWFVLTYYMDWVS
jgi:hypothetical protein